MRQSSIVISRLGPYDSVWLGSDRPRFGYNSSVIACGLGLALLGSVMLVRGSVPTDRLQQRSGADGSVPNSSASHPGPPKGPPTLWAGPGV